MIKWLVIWPSASRPTYIGIFGLFFAEIDISDQYDKYVFPSLIILVDSVLGFLPWCNSKGVLFNPVCIVKRITRSARFTLSVKSVPSSIFSSIRFFRVRIALSTTPFPVCSRGVQYSISIFPFLQNSLYSFDIKAPPLSDLIFSGIPYRFKLFVRKFKTSFVSAVLHIFTVSHLLKRSTAIKIWTSPFIRLLCIFRWNRFVFLGPVRLIFFQFSVVTIW